MEPDTVILPFSAETRQGREEIWQTIESLVTLPQAYVEAEAARLKAKEKAASGVVNPKGRWKKTDRPVAKKTLKKAQMKKEKSKKAGKQASKKAKRK